MSIIGKGKVLSVNVNSYRSSRKMPALEANFLKGDELLVFPIEFIPQEFPFPSEFKSFFEDLTIKGITAVEVGDFLKIGEVVSRVKSTGDREASLPKDRSSLVKIYGWKCEVVKDGKIKIGDKVMRFLPIKVGIIIASDKGARGEREDLSGKVIEEKILEIGGEIKRYIIIPDEIDLIAEKIREFASDGCDIIFTSGGTGWSKRDVTPEATLRVIERGVPGLPEIMRLEGYKFTPEAVLSRGVAGILGETLVVNLPGSPKGVRESLDIILPVLAHGINILKGWEKECGRIR